MSYLQSETYLEKNVPCELFKFIIGDGGEGFEVYYTNLDETITYDGNVYVPICIERDSIKASIEVSSQTLQITVPRDNAIVSLFRNFIPQDEVYLTIYRKHRDDADTITIWFGKIVETEFKGSECIIKGMHIIGFFDRQGPSNSFIHGCSHCFGDEYCGLDLETAVTVEGLPIKHENIVIDTIDDTKVNLTGSDIVDLACAGGLVINQYGEKRTVTYKNGTAIQINYPFEYIEEDDQITIYEGCPKTFESCSELFNNNFNFSGCKFIPFRNPHKINFV